MSRHNKARFSLVRVCALLLLLVTNSAIASIIIVNMDGPDEGFNDTTPVLPVGGNPGETLGQQRINIFNEAARLIALELDIRYPIKVEAKFDPLFCAARSATLGSAGPAAWTTDRNMMNVVPDALQNQLSRRDIDPESADITATFNSGVDNNLDCLANTNWYYGFDKPPGFDISLLSTVMHELIHGFGFVSLLRDDGESGSWIQTRNLSRQYFYDPFTENLKDGATGKLMREADANRRRLALTSETQLLWNGEYANDAAAEHTSGLSAGQLQMYAPATYSGGSSVSHFNTNVTPNELMEPFDTGFNTSSALSFAALRDIGWTQRSISTANTAPVLATIGDRSLPEDGSLSFPLSATDADGDSVSFSLDTYSAELGVTLSGSTLSINPNSQFNGSGTITVSVSDGIDFDSETFTVAVTAVNDAPVLASIRDQSLNEESSTSLSLSATDVDGDPLIYQVDSTPAALGISISGATLSINPVNDFTGSSTVTVSVSDGSLSDSQTFTVTVNNVNDAPVLATIGDRSLPEDGSLSFPLSATDADGDGVSFSLDNHSAALGVTLSGSTLSINPNSQFNGSGTITVSVSDGVDSDSETFTVAVTAVNDAPVLAGISDLSVNEESSTFLSLSATDVDSDLLTYQIDSTPAALGASISGATLSINPVNDFTGSSTVTVSVSDGSLSDSQTFTVTVNNVNDAPVISAIGNLQFDWGDTRSLTLTATDVDLDSLTFSASSSDTSVITTSVSGSTLTLTPTTSNTVSATITVTVTDGSLSASTSFTAELTEPTSTTSATQLGVLLDGTAFLDEQTYEAGLNPVSIVPTGGAGNYTVTVFYDGVDRSELLSGSAMLLPETGAFAGTYSVDISDGGGTSLSVYIDRPLRLTPSVNPLMQNTSSASLMIQGAPSGTSIGLVSSTGISFADSDGNSVTSTTAPDAADTYNATTISLKVADVLNGSVTVSATNIPDSTTSLDIVEARTVTMTVVDTNGRPVRGADVTFKDERFSKWGLDTEYETDDNGQVELAPPAIDLEAQIDGEEYRSRNSEIPAAATTAEVALEPASIAYRLSGLITAQGFTFSSESPAVTLQLTDGSEVTVELLPFSNTRIEYTWESTLGSALPETLTVSHSAVPPVQIALNRVASEELVDVALISETDEDSAAGAGQIGYGLIIAFGLLALLPRRRSKTSPKTNPKAA